MKPRRDIIRRVQQLVGLALIPAHPGERRIRRLIRCILLEFLQPPNLDVYKRQEKPSTLTIIDGLGDSMSACRVACVCRMERTTSKSATS